MSQLNLLLLVSDPLYLEQAMGKKTQRKQIQAQI